MNRLRTILLAVAVASLAGAGYLSAQPNDPPGDPTPDVGVPVEETAELSPSQMTDKSDAILADMNEVLKRVLELQKAARAQKDIIKLNCVNDKLLQVKQLLNIAESARTDLVEAISNRDEEGRYHQFSQITIAGENSTTLREEAEACVGEELVFVGPTEVQVDEPEIQDDPTIDDGFGYEEVGGGLPVERPAFVSPFF